MQCCRVLLRDGGVTLIGVTCQGLRLNNLQFGVDDCAAFAQKKQHWLGSNYAQDGPVGNDINRTNVPDNRIAFRHETYLEELLILALSFKQRVVDVD